MYGAIDLFVYMMVVMVTGVMMQLLRLVNNAMCVIDFQVTSVEKQFVVAMVFTETFYVFRSQGIAKN